MRKRILLVTLLVTVVGILLMAVFFSEIYYRVSVSETERRLQTYIAKFDPSAALGDESARALSEELFGTRVTFLLKDGTAVGDSHAESAQLVVGHQIACHACRGFLRPGRPSRRTVLRKTARFTRRAIPPRETACRCG